MIVTCESCKSRYKLDDSKITGRGAKITCPKCRHVFVVLAGGVSAPKGYGPGSPGWEEDEPTKVDESSQSEPKAPARPVIVQPSATAALGASPPPTVPANPVHEVVRPSAPPPAAAAPPAAPKGDWSTRAVNLDFRKVGVTAWKAKIKVGLVYDFSDIKTLRRYITDGRVTPSDVISWDGKTWKPIGDIPDLDRYFVEVYEMLEAQQATRVEEAPAKAPVPADIGSVAAALAAEPAPERQIGPTFQDPFERANRPPARAARPGQGGGRKPATTLSDGGGTKSGGLGWVGIVIGALALVAVGAWYATRGENVAPAAPVVASKPAPRTSEKPDKPATSPSNPAIEKVPIDPSPPTDDAPITAVTDAAGNTVPSATLPQDEPGRSAIPEGFHAVVPSSVPKATNPTTVSTSAPTAAVSAPASASRTSTSQDDVDVGDAAAASGDWSTAVAAYTKARSHGDRSAATAYKLGQAQLRSGDADGAVRTLEAIKAAYPAAHALLADAYDKLGDSAKANAERAAGGH